MADDRGDHRQEAGRPERGSLAPTRAQGPRWGDDADRPGEIHAGIEEGVAEGVRLALQPLAEQPWVAIELEAGVESDVAVWVRAWGVGGGGGARAAQEAGGWDAAEVSWEREGGVMGVGGEDGGEGGMWGGACVTVY